MTEKPYGLVHAKSLLGPCSEEKYWIFDDRGFSPSCTYEEAERLGLDEEYKLLSWRPAMVFAHDKNAPDSINTPALAFPFDARDLAAFMLNGVGSLVADFYGDWETGPDASAIRQIDHADNFARKAVEQAYVAYREALKIIGPYPLELDAEADRARKVWSLANHDANQREGVFDFKPGTEDSKARRERANASIAVSKMEMETSEAEANAARQKWLEAMVRELLEPRAVTSKLETVVHPIQRSAAQDAVILKVIKDMGLDPLLLPRNEAGKPGVKAKVRETVGKNTLFTGSTVFEKAWERLTANHDIVICKVSP